MIVISIITPSKKYKPYIDFVLGLVLVSIVVAPISKFIGKNSEPISFVYSMDMSSEANKYIQDYEKKQEEIINTQFKNHIQQQIISICKNEYEVEVSEVAIELNGDNVSQIEVYVKDSVNIDNLKNRLSLSYNLSTKHINIYI